MLVNERWTSDCISADYLTNPQGKLYRVRGSPEAAVSKPGVKEVTTSNELAASKFELVKKQPGLFDPNYVPPVKRRKMTPEPAVSPVATTVAGFSSPPIPSSHLHIKPPGQTSSPDASSIAIPSSPPGQPNTFESVEHENPSHDPLLELELVADAGRKIVEMTRAIRELNEAVIIPQLELLAKQREFLTAMNASGNGSNDRGFDDLSEAIEEIKAVEGLVGNCK